MYTPRDAWKHLEPYQFMQTGCMDHIMAARSEEFTDIMFDNNCTVIWDRITNKVGEIVAGEEVQEMLRNEKVPIF